MFKINKSKTLNRIALHMVLLLSFQAAFPTTGFALTSGPSQPEFAGFEPATTTEMVDLFSGDFTYNIPLFELPGPDGGYPFNLAYNSGVSMDQEASWVGLGWSLNPGAINRNLRGLPDDFDGDIVKKRTDMLPSETIGFTVNGHLEFFGYDPKKLPKNTTNESSGGLNLALQVTHNNYTGWGMGVNLGFNTSVTRNVYAGANLGVHSQEGANLSPNLSLRGRTDDHNYGFSLGFGMNSREGLNSLSLGTSLSTRNENFTSKSEDLTVVAGLNGNVGYTHNFGRRLYMPSIQTDKIGTNAAFGAEYGWWSGASNLGAGVHTNVSIEKEALANEFRDYKSYGYLHSKNLENKDRAILDFSKEKVSVLDESSTNLAVPLNSPDIFMVQGQGTGGTFRAHRSDIGTFSDSYYQSLIGGGKFDGEVAFNPGVPLGVDVGLGFGGNWSNSKNKKWNDIQNIFEFDNHKSPSSDYEPFYFKGGSEHTAEALGTYDHLGGDDAFKLELNNIEFGTGPINLISIKKNPSFQINELEQRTEIAQDENFKRKNGERRPRANNLQPITNEDLLINGNEALREYEVSYFEYEEDKTYLENQTKPQMESTPLDRTLDQPAHHIAGFTALQPTGLRYVYGLPVRNFAQHELQYSLDPDFERSETDYLKTIDIDHSNGEINYNYENSDASDDFIHETVTPQYNSAHLLTCVLGSDYIDIDNFAGPSKGDYGYWVKFNYAKIDGDYLWKAPFEGANFVRNSINSDRDDRAALTHGNREQYYLASAETRTHIAVFNLQKRADAKGAPSAYHNAGENLSNAASSYLLHQIDLYSRLETEQPNAVPIKSVKLEYDYSLCPNIPNNDNAEFHESHTGQSVYNAGGKLTLKKLWFTYENSKRGKLSPYQFTYTNNPEYSTHNYDRWGNYQFMENDEAIDFPYTKQEPGIADINASAWSLTNIKMPSGSAIQVKYEADDYAHVQDRKAMRMFEMVRANGDSGLADNEVPTEELIPGEYNEDWLKVYFKLDDPANDVPEDYFSDIHGAKIVDGQLELSDNSQLLFKIRSEINGSSDTEFITLYADIDNEHSQPFGIEGGLGYVRLKPVNLGLLDKDGGTPEDKNSKFYHPFCANAWQVLKTKYNDRMSDVPLANDDGSSVGEAMGDFVNNFREILDLFRKYYTTCSRRGFAGHIDLANSRVRLNTPNQIKKGGGARVHEIQLLDGWDIGEDGVSDTNTYGQVFDYTTEDENGETISSGVAINEPFIGGEETALRYAKIFSNRVRFRDTEYQSFEYPINESLYPGASVGYSKVTVKSLATAIKTSREYADNPDPTLPDGFGATGITVNEFYTAKDFPVIVNETILTPRIGVPHSQWAVIGMIKRNFYAGSQGYSITLNDMHGKPAKISHFGLDNLSTKKADPENSISYTYFETEANKTELNGSKKVRALANEVPVLLNDSSLPGADGPMVLNQELGVERDFIVSADKYTSNAGNLDVEVNLDITIPIPPAPIIVVTAWPSFNLSFGSTKTVATNKIIRRSGILKSVNAFDGQANIITSNEVFDPLTGEALLTSVTNDFDEEVYNYSMPARYAYEGMGAAYENWGMCVDGILKYDVNSGYIKLTGAKANANKLIVGDECLLTNTNEELENYTWLMDYVFTYVGKQGDSFLFENRNTEGWNSNIPATLMVTRSGKRNHLSTKAMNIVSLENPLTDRKDMFHLASNVIADVNGNGTLNSQSIPQTTLGDVISATATTFDDCWDLERGSCEEQSISIEIPDPGVCNCLYVQLTAMSDLINTDACEDLVYTVEYDINGMPYTYLHPFGFGGMVNEGDVDEVLVDCAKGPIVVTNQEITTPCDSDQYDGIFEGSTYIGQVTSCGPSSEGHCLYAGFFPESCSNNTGGPPQDGFYESVFISFTVNNVPTTVEITTHLVNSASASCVNDLLGNETYFVGCFPFEPQNISYSIEAVNCELSDFEFFDCTNAGNGSGAPGPPFTGGGTAATVTLPSANFENGQRGIWRPQASYVYTKDYITATNSDKNPDLSSSGVYKDLPIFNFKNSRWLDGNMLCDWRRSNEITAYAANGQESENRSATGNYSAALFGYADNVPIAVGQNTDRNDFGYESFEEMDVNLDGELNGNLFFEFDPQDIVFSERYNITALMNSSGTALWTDKPFNAQNLVPQKVKLNLFNENGERVLVEANVLSQYKANHWAEGAAYNPFIPNGTGYELSGANISLSGFFGGTATLLYCKDGIVSSGNAQVGLATVRRHTGELGLYVENGVANFPQPKLNLEHLKKYTISAWVSVVDNQQITFDNGTTYLEVEGTSGVQKFYPTGPVIEGWQKIEGEFTYNASLGDVVIKYSSLNRRGYLDDIRIYPSEGSMQSYVYYPENYRLRATLDQNNFATFYHYDESGQLFLIKKETEDGIKTIQETRGYIKNTLN